MAWSTPSCTLAEVAHFSPFHFHRLFSAWMGETLGDYLRRRRVEVAAMRLVAQPRVTVLQTALSVGFGSAEAFTRAFKARPQNHRSLPAPLKKFWSSILIVALSSTI